MIVFLMTESILNLNQVVLRWVKHQLADRQEFSPALMAHVR